MVRYIGMDVHREFAQLAVLEDGLVRDEGKIGVTPGWPDVPVPEQPDLHVTGDQERSSDLADEGHIVVVRCAGSVLRLGRPGRCCMACR
jgi:hypothetical protein